jgi:hypothetical protein
MSERGKQLHAIADQQIGELIDLLATLDDTTLRLACPGREKLGDGTVAASVQHTADNYQRIADFAETSDQMTGGPEPNGHGAHRLPRFLKALGHRPPDHAEHHHDDAGRHDDQYTPHNVDLDALREHLAAIRESLSLIAALTDSQLQTIPPDGSFRFCDGKRTLDQVLDSLLKHQSHQIQAINAAITTPRDGPARPPEAATAHQTSTLPGVAQTPNSGASGLVAGDTCPDNALYADGQLTLIDFEAAAHRHVAWQAAYLLVPLPTCWCSWALPDQVAQRALAQWRQSGARAISAVAAAFLADDLARAVIAWTFVSLTVLLPRAIAEPAARSRASSTARLGPERAR